MFKIIKIQDKKLIKPSFSIIKRKAIRGVIFKENKILLIHTNKGDYKFPGGGIEKDETIKDALRREILEETGFLVASIGDVVGEVLEKKLDKYQSETVFEMESIYLKCRVNNKRISALNLDDYERDQDFKPIFISLEKAIENNENLLESKTNDLNDWVKRDTDVLIKLIEMRDKNARY